MKKILSFIIILSMIFSMSIGIFAKDSAKTETTNFTDVDRSSTQGQAIYKLVQSGILCGYGDNSFRPNNSLTRAELCKIINLAFNYTEADGENFSDVKKEDWFYPYVAIAKKAGYIKGHGDGTFRGNDFLTREEACVVICRVAGLYDIPFTGTIKDEISDWAVPYVHKVLASRIMNVEADGSFRATSNITRGELTVSVSYFVQAPTTPEDDKKEDETPKPSGGGGGGGSETPGGGSENPGGGNETPGGGSENPGGGNETPGGGNETPGAGNENPGAGNENPGAGNENPGGGNENPGGGNETPGGGNETPGTPSEPEIDQEKLDETVSLIKGIISGIEDGEFDFSESEYAILLKIKPVMEKVRDDGEIKKIAIYENNYVRKTYKKDIDMAEEIYESLTKAEKSSFKSNLFAYFSSSEVYELSLILFGKTPEELID